MEKLTENNLEEQKQLIIRNTADYVMQEMRGESSGHDWWHVYRVWKTAAHIGKEEGADLLRSNNTPQLAAAGNMLE